MDPNIDSYFLHEIKINSHMPSSNTKPDTAPMAATYNMNSKPTDVDYMEHKRKYTGADNGPQKCRNFPRITFPWITNEERMRLSDDTKICRVKCLGGLFGNLSLLLVSLTNPGKEFIPPNGIVFPAIV